MNMSTDESLDPVEETSESATPIQSANSQSGFSRRTFLKAAALGTAAAALLNRDALGNLDFGASSAFADDLSNLGCTANDVQLLGTGKVINEPCTCSAGSSFTAQVVFTIFNNASSARNCVELHLCPATATITVGSTTTTSTFANTGFVALTSSIAGKTTATVTASVPWVCGAGVVCFGTPPIPGGGGNPTCPPGACCTVITWRIPGESTNCSTAIKFIKSKCGMQSVCIVGRSNGLTCTGNCGTGCGGVSTLVASQTGGTGPYTFCLSPGNQVCQTDSSSSVGATVSFTVTTTETTTYTVVETNGTGTAVCAVTESLTLTATPLGTLTVTAPSTADCSGAFCVTATVSGADKYCFSVGTTTLCSTTTNVNCYTVRPGLTSQIVTISVVGSNAADCTSPGAATVTVNPVITVSLSSPTASTCAALSASTVTFTASASGGTGSGFAFQYVIKGCTSTVTSPVTGSTLLWSPTLDACCYTILATATDSNSCPSSNTASASVEQCVNTFFSCAV
jgi:hypothetical protein